MNRHSILFKIIIFFIVALVATTALFKVMYTHEFTSAKANLRTHYHHVAMSIMRWKFAGGSKNQLLKDLKTMNIEIVKDASLKKSILQTKSIDRVSCARGHFDLYELGDYRYIVTPKATGSIILKDLKTEFINVNYVWVLYGFFIVILCILFISIAISIYPLKQLQRKIKKFGEGNNEIDFSTTRKDEIADVANEFDHTLKKIQNMIDARVIFLRNVTHELKTPITKGQLSLEFLEDSRTKTILSNVFVRLTILVQEFLHIENVTACDCVINKKSYHIADILNNACDLLFLEPDSITHNLDNEMIEVDFNLASIVFKNLIDNGIKYADDAAIFLYYENNTLAFCSRGEKMDKPLEHYTKAFTKESIKNINHSFGSPQSSKNSILIFER
ncbi:HAMP domain-containing histidine kinase [Sulfurimonas sediminis]|uniref:histidine kinase n=1 Tax=Sulfurimonas sediminis TaxID=2590020 RepID=A0A7M1B6Z0_9BACT|nr:ArsS family sensor histidine kinase [Sulfurimonas sediminis]QOP44538.1 HAMP domain-containing histidine kinase [Sulfurimonas sediminis]